MSHDDVWRKLQRLLVQRAAWRHAQVREMEIGERERPTSIEAKLETKLLLINLYRTWRIERKASWLGKDDPYNEF